MLITCPECELQVSDKALNCPHCGYPILTKDKPKKRESKKLKRLPNGFGDITEIKGKPLRNPFRARVTVGHTGDLKPIRRNIGYYKTYNEAYAALVEYKKNPYDLDSDITVAQLYEKWSEGYFETLTSDASKRTITAAWAYCSELYHMRVKEVRPRHIRGVMDNGYRIETKGKKKGEKIFASAGVKERIKSLFNLMLDYALENEIVIVNYARTFDLSKETQEEIEETKRGHIIFTEEELETLWSHVDDTLFVDWILIQCYMGWRPQEMGLLELDNIDLEARTIRGGIKTKAGKMRVVPIHSRILNLVQKNIMDAKATNSPYLLNDRGATHSQSNKVTYDKYAGRFEKVIATLKLNPLHRPHDPRMTFVTRLKKAGADEGAVKKLVGHKERDITESAYTDRDIEWLRTDVERMQ